MAKSELFIQLANDLAKQIALRSPLRRGAADAAVRGQARQTVHERIGETVGLVRENMRVARFTRLTGISRQLRPPRRLGRRDLQVEGDKGDRRCCATCRCT